MTSYIDNVFFMKQKETSLYHIKDGSFQITTEPLTLEEIRAKFGGVLRLERNGFRVIKVDKQVTK